MNLFSFKIKSTQEKKKKRKRKSIQNIPEAGKKILYIILFKEHVTNFVEKDR